MKRIKKTTESNLTDRQITLVSYLQEAIDKGWTPEQALEYIIEKMGKEPKSTLLNETQSAKMNQTDEEIQEIIKDAPVYYGELPWEEEKGEQLRVEYQSSEIDRSIKGPIFNPEQDDLYLFDEAIEMARICLNFGDRRINAWVRIHREIIRFIFREAKQYLSEQLSRHPHLTPAMRENLIKDYGAYTKNLRQCIEKSIEKGGLIVNDFTYLEDERDDLRNRITPYLKTVEPEQKPEKPLNTEHCQKNRKDGCLADLKAIDSNPSVGIRGDSKKLCRIRAFLKRHKREQVSEKLYCKNRYITSGWAANSMIRENS